MILNLIIVFECECKEPPPPPPFRRVCTFETDSSADTILLVNCKLRATIMKKKNTQIMQKNGIVTS